MTSRHLKAVAMRALALGVMGMVANGSAMNAAAPQTQTFRSRVDLVQIDVRVVDRQGQPVEGLTPDDFILTEDSRVQDVTQFRTVSIAPGDRPVEQASGQPVRDDVTNDEPPTPRAVVLFIDTFHLVPNAETLTRVRRIVTDTLRGLSETDDVAIVFADRSDLSIGFNRELALQVQAVEKIRAALRSAGRVPPGAALTNLRSAFATLKNVCDVLATTAHTRKAVVYVGEGLDVDLASPKNSEYLAAVQATVQSAVRAGVVVHAIDPRGLLTPLSQEDTLRFQRERDFLTALTLDSGGGVVAGSSNLGAGVRDIVQEISDFYVLGYSPAPPQNDGEFHPVVVEVRNPDWRVIARRGYWAPAPDKPGNEPADAWMKALTRSFPVSDVPLRAVATPSAPAGADRVQTRFTIEIGGENPIGQPWELAVVALTPDAKPVASGRRRVTAVPAPDGSGRGLVSAALDIPPGLRAIRLGLQQVATGAVGTVHFALDIPDLSGERISAGGVFVGRGDNETGEMVTVASRSFTTAGLPTVRLPLYWRASDGAQMQVTATIRRGDDVVAERRDTLDADATSTSGERRSAAFIWDLETTALAAGNYQMDIVGTVDGRRVTRAVQFEVRSR